MKTISAAFIKAKRDFSPAVKNSKNDHFKNRYADLAACLDAVNESFLNNGIAVFQETSDDATGVTVETVLLHESGESLRFGKLHVPAAKQDPQGYGSALTYARRYSLMTACGIAGEDDDGEAARKAKISGPKVEVYALGDSIKIITKAKNLEELTALWKSEVTKFVSGGPDYNALKNAATNHRSFLNEMSAA